jgi:SAM-dependent methyltransferase
MQTPPPHHHSWEAAYERELHNHTSDTTDEGVIWFDESAAEDRVVRKLRAYDAAEGGPLDRARARFLDLGTGNGHMLFALREDEAEAGDRWRGDLVGVDYSWKSVELAGRIDERRRAALEEEDDDDGRGWARVMFRHWDILADAPGEEWLGDGFDVVLDKGTFDAISLMPRTEGTPHPCEVYRDKVAGLIKPGRFLFITSCNWTKEELIDWLTDGEGTLVYHDEAEYPTFRFGGQVGQSVVSLVFRKDAG